MVCSQLSSSTSRTSIRAGVLRPVGRYGVAMKAARSARHRSVRRLDRGRMVGRAGLRPVRRSASRGPSGSARPMLGTPGSRVTATGFAPAPATRTRSRPGRRQRPAPSRPAGPGSTTAGPGWVTGRMKDSSSAVEAPASTELTTPAKSTTNATTAIDTAATQAVRDVSVPTVTSTAPVTARARWAWTRCRIGPPKSTSRSRANDPNAANVPRVGLPSTSTPNANWPA